MTFSGDAISQKLVEATWTEDGVIEVKLLNRRLLNNRESRATGNYTLEIYVVEQRLDEVLSDTFTVIFEVVNSESGENKPPFFIGNFFNYKSFDLSSEGIGQSSVTLGQLIDTEGD